MNTIFSEILVIFLMITTPAYSASDPTIECTYYSIVEPNQALYSFSAYISLKSLQEYWHPETFFHHVKFRHISAKKLLEMPFAEAPNYIVDKHASAYKGNRWTMLETRHLWYAIGFPPEFKQMNRFQGYLRVNAVGPAAADLVGSTVEKYTGVCTISK